MPRMAILELEPVFWQERERPDDPSGPGVLVSAPPPPPRGSPPHSRSEQDSPAQRPRLDTKSDELSAAWGKESRGVNGHTLRGGTCWREALVLGVTVPGDRLGRGTGHGGGLGGSPCCVGGRRELSVPTASSSTHRSPLLGPGANPLSPALLTTGDFTPAGGHLAMSGTCLVVSAKGQRRHPVGRVRGGCYASHGAQHGPPSKNDEASMSAVPRKWAAWSRWPSSPSQGSNDTARVRILGEAEAGDVVVGEKGIFVSFRWR